MTSPPARWRWRDPPSELADALARGAVLAIPTESSYALAVDPRRRDAVESVFRLKGRPAGQPLPVVAGDRRQIAALGVELSHPGLARLAAGWPAPLSLIAPLRRPLPAAAGSGSLAVRIPAHDRLRRLLRELGCALTATSANLSGEPPVLEPDGLERLLGGQDAVVVDDGALPGGPPSTLVAAANGGLTVVRLGRYPKDELRRLAPGLEITLPISADSVEMSVDRKSSGTPPSRRFGNA